MKRISYCFFIPLFLLSGCQEEKKEIAYIDQNGDFFVSEPKDYDDLPEINASLAIEEAKKDIPTTFVVAHYDCSFCQKFKPIFLSVLVNEGYYFETLYRSEKNSPSEQEAEIARYNEELFKLQKAYGSKDDNGGISGDSPSIYSLTALSATYFDMYDDNNSFSKFKSYLNRLLHKTNIYHFTSFSSYEKFNLENNTITFISDPSKEDSLTFYSKTIYPLAKKSEKSLCYIDLNRLNEEEKGKFENAFGTDSLKASLYANGKTISLNSEEASSLITEYYR